MITKLVQTLIKITNERQNLTNKKRNKKYNNKLTMYQQTMETN